MLRVDADRSCCYHICIGENSYWNVLVLFWYVYANKKNICALVVLITV